MVMYSDFYKLILVTHRQDASTSKYLDFIESCVSLKGGVTCVQLREKNTDPVLTLKWAQKLKDLLNCYSIPLIINDNLDLANEVDAEGVHLGQSDVPVHVARKRLGDTKFIGLSIESESELNEANYYDINYISASAVFPSQHKNNLSTFWGIDGLRQLCKKSIHPVVGIGGINRNNVSRVIQAGAQGVAVIGALHKVLHPAQTALALRKIIDRGNR